MSKSEIDLLIKERENLILRVIEIDRLLNDAGISQENSSNLKVGAICKREINNIFNNSNV